ncbi:MAG: NfeD family protein [Cocleimonas sp.]|nr:NfeD family protein [Cocleimonas sp.]
MRRKVRNAYFEHLNPKLGQLREEVNGFGFLKRITLPNDFSMWFGIAAGVTGFSLLLDNTMEWYWQLFLMLFIIFIGPSILKVVRSLFQGADNVLAVYPGKQLIGQKITLKKEIKGGKGEVVFKGDTWSVQGDDLAAGTRVKVVAVKKDVLYVVNAMKEFDEV